MASGQTIEMNLKERQAVVQALWNAVNEGGSLIQDLPRIVRTLIEQRAWEEREVNGKIVENKTFIDFITDDPLKGCGWKDPKKVEALLKGDKETLVLWHNAIKIGQGSRTDIVDNINDVVSAKGTSLAYTLDRLKRERRDLFQQVVDGEMSANAAAIKAGFRKPPSPFKQIVKLLPKLSVSERDELRAPAAPAQQ